MVETVPIRTRVDGVTEYWEAWFTRNRSDHPVGEMVGEKGENRELPHEASVRSIRNNQTGIEAAPRSRIQGKESATNCTQSSSKYSRWTLDTARSTEHDRRVRVEEPMS